MSDQSTARLALPLLQPGQAQKEMTHNEALALVDMAMQATAASMTRSVPPAEPIAGQCWIVGAAPTGAWLDRAGALAAWTPGGWRFVAPREGMVVWLEDEQLAARFVDGRWVAGVTRLSRVEIDGVAVLGAQQAAIPEPDGGETVDGEARATLHAILSALRTHGLIAA